MEGDAINFRHWLHKHPELSKKEESTASWIIAQFKALGVAEESIISNIGGHGFIVQFKGNEPGPTIAFRAELDALPIQENSNHDHASEIKGKMHACGHDGHMACLFALGQELQLNPPKKGTIILLFQPAEEIGEGAQAMIDDQSKTFSQIPVDYIFAFHNIPGYPLGQVLIREGTFACASTGIEIQIHGKPSHAAYPENGTNPSLAIAEFIPKLNNLPAKYPDALAMCTICYINAGEEAYGTAAGNAKMCLTIRSDNNDVFISMKEYIQSELNRIIPSYGLSYTLHWIEPFEATVNNKLAIEHLRNAVSSLKLSSFDLPNPMRWSEDFGVFTGNWKSAFFGLGSGENSPQLHNENFDFPNQLIPIAKSIYCKLIESIHSKDQL